MTVTVPVYGPAIRRAPGATVVGRLTVTSTLPAEAARYPPCARPVCGQFVPVVQVQFDIVNDFEQSRRGEGGFGSSGRH